MNLFTNIIVGNELKELTNKVKDFKKRDCYSKILKFLNGDYYDHICSLFGLNGTGKSILLLQTIASMSKVDFEKTVYIKLSAEDEMDYIMHDLDILHKSGYKFVFLEDVTRIKDFADGASFLSDIYSMMGMKIVVTGDESTAIWLSSCDELYDRVFMLHTSNISYEEYNRILGVADIDKYLKSCGTLYEKIDVDKYIKEAVCDNIIFSLSKSSERYRDDNCLLEWYSDNDLRKIIIGVIDDINIDYIKRAAEEIGVDINCGHTLNNIKDMDIRRIIRILKNIDFISDCFTYLTPDYFDSQKNIIILQPGIRYYLGEKRIRNLEENGNINGDSQKLIDKIKDDIIKEILPENISQKTENIIHTM